MSSKPATTMHCQFCARPCCEGNLHTAPMPAQPLPKSLASPGLLASIATAKYVDALPLYRQHQHSTGGRLRLLGISKRGDCYLRTLLIHGARAALRTASRHEDRRSRWAFGMEQRRGKNIAAVALANKNARTAWAMLAKESDFDREHLEKAA